jgi:hypothetical protein
VRHIEYRSHALRDNSVNGLTAMTHLTPQTLSNFASLRGEEEPEKPRSVPPLHVALRSNAELERGLGGEVRLGIDANSNTVIVPTFGVLTKTQPHRPDSGIVGSWSEPREARSARATHFWG